MLGVNSFLYCLVLVSELLGVLDHLFDLLLSEATLVVRNRNCLRFANALLNTGNSEDRVLVNLKGYFDLGNTSGRGWDTI